MVWLWQMRRFYGRASAQLFLHDSGSASGHLATGQLRHRQRLATMCGILTCLPMSVQVLAKIVAMDCLQKVALKKGFLSAILSYDSSMRPAPILVPCWTRMHDLLCCVVARSWHSLMEAVSNCVPRMISRTICDVYGN